MKDNSKILIICGLTATGKTNLSLSIARKLNGEIISADSRQVYKGLDIGTGKDIPHGFVWRKSGIRFGIEHIGYYTDGKVRLWGYDLVNPQKDFSVSDFITVGRKILKDIVKRGKLPIVTGGTGFYIQGLLDGVETMGYPLNKKLRLELEGKSLEFLKKELKKLSIDKFELLNNSDLSNPRRLMRAIEVEKYKLRRKKIKKIKKLEADCLFVGLTAGKKSLVEMITKRIEERLKEGVEKEVNGLLQVYDFSDKAFSACGYSEVKRYIEGKISKDEMIKEWLRSEIKYSRKQLVWFKRNNKINWFNVEETGYCSKIELLVGRWYSKIS
jgi:tRNA dimethylallyltransferase